MANSNPATYQLADRNLGLDLMRVTEAAATAAGRERVTRKAAPRRP